MAEVGDRIIMAPNAVGVRDRQGEIIEVRGADGPYMVRFDDGHEALVMPGPDDIIQPASGS